MPSRSRTFGASERRERARPGNQYPRLILPHDPFVKRSSLHAGPCQITVSLASAAMTLALSPRDVPRICRRIFIAAAGISLFASLGLLSVRNSTQSILETNINGEYREIQLASLSKRIIKLTRRGLIMFFPFRTRD